MEIQQQQPFEDTLQVNKKKRIKSFEDTLPVKSPEKEQKKPFEGAKNMIFI